MKNKAIFWDRVALVYEFFVNVINYETHKNLNAVISQQFSLDDLVLECACGGVCHNNAKGKKRSNQKGFRVSAKYEIRKLVYFLELFYD